MSDRRLQRNKSLKSVGRIIKRLRHDNGLSQIELARAAGFDRTYVSMLERSIRFPTLAAVFKLAHALNLTAAEFVGLVETEENFMGNQFE